MSEEDKKTVRKLYRSIYYKTNYITLNVKRDLLMDLSSLALDVPDSKLLSYSLRFAKLHGKEFGSFASLEYNKDVESKANTLKKRSELLNNVNEVLKSSGNRPIKLAGANAFNYRDYPESDFPIGTDFNQDPYKLCIIRKLHLINKELGIVKQ